MGRFLAIILLTFNISPSFGQDDVDHVALAQILIKDGNFQRAQKTLEKVKIEDHAEPALVYSLWGMVELNNRKPSKALRSFEKSLSAGLKNTEIFLYMAEAHLQLKQWLQAESSLDHVSETLKSKLPYHLLLSEVHWRQGRQNQAWRVLNEALTHGLSKTILKKKKFSYLLEKGLFETAMMLAKELSLDKNNFNDVLAMASQLRIKDQNQKALELLQALKMLKPGHEIVVLEMAQNYLQLRQNFSATLVLEEAAKHNNSLAYEAAELLRQEGKSYRARYLNMLTTEPKKKLKQQLALLLEEDDYFSLSMLVPQLRHHQLLDDQKIKYAVAYSYFKTGEFKKSEYLLNSIDEGTLFNKSIELKKEIANCQQQSWFCESTI